MVWALTFRSKQGLVPSTLARPVTQKAIIRVVLAGFTLVILLLLASGLLAIRNINSIRSTTAELLEEQVRIQDLLDAVLKEQRAINAIYATFAKEPEQLDREQMLSQLEASDRDIEEIATAAADEPAQALWQNLYKGVTHFSTEARTIIHDKTNRAAPLRQLMTAHQSVLSLVDRLVEVQAQRSVQLKQQIEEASTRMFQQSTILLGASLLLALVCAVYTVRLTVSLIRQLEWQTGELSRVSWNLLEKQETTARRFSHELHDELGQSLTAVKANLVAVADHADGARDQVDDCIHLVDEAIMNVRELSQLLRPTILDDFGLPASLKWLCDRFTQRTGIDVEFTSNFEERLADETETHLFRIAQEALTNVARHSKASRAEISLQRENGQILLRIADNGQGVGQESDQVNLGVGMVGMRARARSAGGELKVSSAPGQGLTIFASFPVVARQD
jgi:signal transduction histidine kinase